MKQLSSLLSISIFKRKSKHFYLQELHQNAQLQVIIQANITVGKKTKNLLERPHLLSGLFIKVFYKTTTCPRLPLLSVPKSGRLIVLYRFDCIKFIIFLKDLVAFINYLSVSANDFMYCYFSFVHMLLLILCYNYFIMS